MTAPGRIDVQSATGSYPVLVGRGVADVVPGLAAEHAPGGSIGVISDSNVGPLHAERIADACRLRKLDVTLLTFPAGEESKSRERWARLTDELLDAGLGRDGCIVAVGGGVTTDLAGFVAATYMRGVPVVQVPTSYLAMIDASVGGKTGVDVEEGKNLVGAFHPPVAVVADTGLLRTLPAEERREGLVEAVKHGAILDEAHLHALEARLDDLLAADPEAATEVVLASVALKADVVSHDERESGYRQILNFGHTVGHALEAASGYRLGHGSAVALGMLAEAEMGERMGVTRAGVRRRLAGILDALTSPAAELPSAAEASEYLGRDKKARGGHPRYVLLEDVGRVSPGDGWTHDVPDDLAHEALRRVTGEA